MSTIVLVAAFGFSLVAAYLLGRQGRAPVSPAPAAHAASHPPDAGAALYRLAGELVPFFQASAHPKDLLDNPDFGRGVQMLRGASWSVDTLLGYYAGDNAVIACLALEALRLRDDDADVRRAIRAGINDFNPWNRYFSLRLLDAKSPAPAEPIVGRLRRSSVPSMRWRRRWTAGSSRATRCRSRRRSSASCRPRAPTSPPSSWSASIRPTRPSASTSICRKA